MELRYLVYDTEKYMVILKEMNYIVFAQPRADSAFCLYCGGAACVLHVVLPRQHPDGGERGGKSGAGHPVTAQVVSRSGARTVGFEIDENHFANLMKADIKDAVYTALGVREFSGSSTARRTCRARTQA